MKATVIYGEKASTDSSDRSKIVRLNVKFHLTSVWNEWTFKMNVKLFFFFFFSLLWIYFINPLCVLLFLQISRGFRKRQIIGSNRKKSINFYAHWFVSVWSQKIFYWNSINALTYYIWNLSCELIIPIKNIVILILKILVFLIIYFCFKE